MEQQSIGNPITYDNNFYLFFECVPQSLMLTEYDSGKIIKINKFFCSIFGFKEQDLLGTSTIEIGFWNNYDRKIFIDDLNQTQSVNGLELMIHNQSGESVCVLLYANLLYLKACKFILTMVVDISDRKQVENALRIDKEKFKSLFYNNAAPIGIVNPDKTIDEVNDAYCRVSGYTREEFIGVSWTESVSANEIERLKDYGQRRLLNPLDGPKEYETCFYNKLGEKRYVHMSVSMMPETGKSIASFIDISEQKCAEILLAKQKEELKTLVTSKNKEITVNLLQIANNNQFNEQLSLKLKKIREQFKLKNPLLLNNIDKLINETATNQKPFNWRLLKDHIMITRPYFLSGLLSKHPNITPAEQKLCTLLCLQMSTKEIALITNQHYDSVRVSRTRLRKKLGLENEEKLVVYLLTL